MDDAASQAITEAIKEIVDQIAPDAHYIAKYGGEVFAPYPGDDSQFVGGIFSYKAHVSLEFSNGAEFDDPERHLEGGGKMRRHLKLHTPEDVDSKKARSFLTQAFEE